MIIELVNRLPVDQCWNFVGEYMDTALWKDSRRTEVIVPGLNVLELESNSYFSSPSGYLIYVSDDQSLFLTIVFKSNSFLARTVSSPPDLRGIYNSSDFDKLADTAARIHRAEGCYWQINDKVSLTVFGRDMSVLSPRETEVCCEADHVPYLQDSSRVSTPMSERPSTPESESLEYVVPGSRSRRVVRITVTNLFTESFILDGDWMNSGKWRVRPFNVPAWAGQTGSQTTTFELCGEAGSITASISGCFWLISEQSKKFFVSFGFDNKPLSSSCFECWAGKPPFDLQRALGKMKSGSGSNPSVTWEVVSRPTSKKLIVNVTIGDSLLPYDASDYPPSKTSTAVATPAAEPQEVSMAIVPVPEGGVVVHPAESGETMIAEALNKSRPKNALAGLGSGLKYMSGGIVAGAAALVSAPVIGAREEGAMGLLKGVAKGVGGFVGLTVAGAAVGVTQLVRGVANTPEAISKGSRRDYKWDKDKGEWIKDVYVLRDLVDQAVQEEADSDDEERAQRGGSSGSAPTAEVKETLYYEVLGVPTNATTQDIKKAYYKKAVVVHPDKNPSPEANKEFQRLSQAYQVLSDPESRKKYDVSGAQKFEDGSHKNESLDVGIFLSGLFGSLKFEPYVGELSLSGFAKDMMKDPTMDPNDIESSMPSAASAAPLKRREKRRRIFCAKNLKDKLDKYVSERNESEFVRSAYLEAMDLVKASFGRQLLRTLAFVYLYTGEKFLAEQKGQFWTRKWASWKNTGRSYSNMANMASNMTKSFMAVNKFANQAEKRGRSENPENQGPSPEEVRAFLENTLPLLLDTAWGMVQMDVEETAKAAAKMVLKDVGVCWQLRMRRGYALRRLGRIFEEVALTYGGETEIGKMTGQDAMRQLEEAFVTTVRETDARRADSNSPSRRR